MSEPADALEREADRVAERVVAGGGLASSERPTVGAALRRPVQRACAACEDELQRKSVRGKAGDVEGAVESQIRGIEGSGSPLPARVRSGFENHLGHDLGNVRIHTSPSAARTASSIDALAFTHGRNIVFAPGQYQPETRGGQKLLAHELTHVVQQRSKSSAAPVARDTVQRLCGPTDIGTQTGCVQESSEPVGVSAFFRVNCDDFASPADEQTIVDFADSMTAGDRVRVHGFASMDGNATFNQNLSCARAFKALEVLILNDIDMSKIDTIQHGPTPGPAAQRRSVVLERVPQLSRPTTPQLRAVIDQAPTPGNCGIMRFVIHWEISRNAHTVNGGFVLQDITFTWRNMNCAGVEVPDGTGKLSPLRYFEAWRFLPGTRNIDPADGNVDLFQWANDDPSGCTVDNVTVNAVARYHDNVNQAAMPAHMIRNNPATFANNLQSSTTDPALAGSISRSVPHRLQFHWNCCPCSSSPTVVDSHTP